MPCSLFLPLPTLWVSCSRFPEPPTPPPLRSFSPAPGASRSSPPDLHLQSQSRPCPHFVGLLFSVPGTGPAPGGLFFPFPEPPTPLRSFLPFPEPPTPRSRSALAVFSSVPGTGPAPGGLFFRSRNRSRPRPRPCGLFFRSRSLPRPRPCGLFFRSRSLPLPRPATP